MLKTLLYSLTNSVIVDTHLTPRKKSRIDAPFSVDASTDLTFK